MKARDLFTTIRTEGGLLPADLLERISRGDGDLKGLDPKSYHLAADERLNEMISRSWNRMVGAWSGFRAASEKLPETDLGTSSTRERWLLVLFQELGYGRLRAASAVEIEGKSYPISHLWDPSPIHLVGFRVDLDRRTPGVAGAARSSPHSLVQEFLNRSDDHLWGFVSNGLRMRILRDNSSLTRQAYVEFDLEGMMEGEVFADFVLLWLLCHQSRIEAEDARPETCWLERWAQAAQERGVRALDTLRKGVEAAIKALGSGFLDHPGNNDLREKLRSGTLSTQDYYRQLLRLVYRLLFLFVAEDRDLLLHPESDAKARERYGRFYSTARLRRMAERLRGTKHADLFRGFRIVMEKLGSDGGCPAFGLPALGSFLWSREAIADLETCDISNHGILEAIRALAFTIEDKIFRSVDFKNLGSEELGSVYESLLELHPEINTDSATFELRTASGHERKTTGSYYTPSSLIQCLMDSALEPVLDEAVKKPDPRQAILDLKVCDPACGSGHFLIAAAHRMARRLAAIETGDEEPAPEAMRHALRQVIGHCIYGVDLNPMAVELCKVGLWLESLEPGKPLSFLDHRILCGNSLLGATPALLAKGIPNGAFKAIEGDDKELVKAFRKQNRDERRGQTTMFAELKVAESLVPYRTLSNGLVNLDHIDDSTIEGIHQKEDLYQTLSQSKSHRRARLLADAWCAAFVWKKTKQFPYPITEGVFRQIEKHPEETSSWMVAEIQRLTEQYQFFHWHLRFPDVFQVPEKGGRPDDEEQTGWSGGFDFVGGNPPWERVKLQEKEWFAGRRPDIARAPNAAARRRMIAALEHEDPAILTEFLNDRRKAEGESHLVRNTSRYPLCGRGDVNTYAVFAELKRGIINPSGRVGCIVPSGIATDDTTKFFFQDLMETRALASLYDFENRAAIFPGVHRSYKFCLLTLIGSECPATKGAEFVFFAHAVEELYDPERRFTLSAEDIALLNPNTRTCPIFRSRRDVELNKHICAHTPVLVPSQGASRWNAYYMRLIDLDDHAEDIRFPWQDKGESWNTPLYESKLVNLFDHRFATFEGVDRAKCANGQARGTTIEERTNPSFQVVTRYLVRDELARQLFAKYQSHTQRWLLVWRDVARATDERTSIAAAIPRALATRSNPSLGFSPAKEGYFLLAGLSSFVFDYLARQKVGGIHFNWQVLAQLPVAPPSVAASVSREFIRSRALELTYTAWDLESFAQDCGWSGPPFRWDEERRFLLRCELDAAFFHLYLSATSDWQWKQARIAEGAVRDETADELAELKKHFPTPRDAVAYIMNTFSIVKRKDEKQYSEYRTKRVILEIYDEMAEAMRTGRPYQTRLNPPAADPRIAHQPRQRERPAAPALVQPRRVGALDKSRVLLLATPRWEERYSTCVPRLDLKIAAGLSSDQQHPDFREWVEVNASRLLRNGMFVAQVVGRSMEPLISDGAYCLFQFKAPHVSDGMVALFDLQGVTDPESEGCFTVKRLRLSARPTPDGPQRVAMLVSENAAFEPIPVEEEGVRMVAEFLEVLRPLDDSAGDG